MKDPLLLPSILPNVFHIASSLDATQFQQLVLPSLKPLFALSDPPQNMIVLLENLGELQKKTAKNVFRSGENSKSDSKLHMSNILIVSLQMCYPWSTMPLIQSIHLCKNERSRLFQNSAIPLIMRNCRASSSRVLRYVRRRFRWNIH